MHSQPRRELQSLLRRYGPALINSPQRVEAFLSDACGQYQREIFVLVHAQQSGILVELGRMVGQQAEGAFRQRLARQLQDRYAFSAEAAAWAVDAWADALGVRAMPAYQSWLIATWHSLRRRIQALSAPKPEAHPPMYRAAVNRAAVNRADRPQPLLGRIGVQWKKLSLRSLLLSLLVVALTATVGMAWRQSGWLPIRSFLAEQSQQASAQDNGQQISQADVLAALALYYPPPLEARIETDLLNVRSAPTLTAEVLGKLGPLGASVTVDGFTEDWAWSHITAPVNGWISNEFVTFAGETTRQRLYIQPALGQTVQADLPVRNSPQSDAPAIARLAAGQTIVVVAVSADGLWRQVTAPSPGWVESSTISLMER